MNESPWYREGLRFGCTRSGNCCRGEGYVWVDEREVAVLARHLNMDVDTFEKVYTRKVGKGRSLRDQANEDCIFYAQGTGCQVYEARPTQCQTWPFWRNNIETEQSWDETKARCPGAGSGALYSAEEILKRLATRKQ